MSPLYEDLDAAALDLGAEVDAEHGQLDAVRAERLHVPVVHEAGQTNQMMHKVTCKIMQNNFKIILPMSRKNLSDNIKLARAAMR